jgi:hypothetical protein
MHKQCGIKTFFLLLGLLTIVLNSPTLASPQNGSHWQLEYFQSMDDQVGELFPQKNTPYTMSFAAAGSVRIELHCSQLNGRWISQAAANDTSGSLRRLNFRGW